MIFIFFIILTQDQELEYIELVMNCIDRGCWKLSLLKGWW